MYSYLLLKALLIIANLLLSAFTLTPLIILLSFFSLVTFYLYRSSQNLFKIFFLTETFLLLIVIFLGQLSIIYPNLLVSNYFYCQLILASAAAEGALFLGLFSYLYDQQTTTSLLHSKTKTLDSLRYFVNK